MVAHTAGRVPSGINVLDRYLGGGLPEGYVVNLRGAPGSGKTLFAAQVASRNAGLGRKTLFVSFLEDRDKFVSAASTLIPQIRKHVDSGRIAYVELSSVVRGGVGPALEFVLENVGKVRPQILVFDSYSALQEAVGSESEARSILSNVFSRIFSRRKITTFVISEGEKEDFVSYVADGIIRLGRRREQDLYIRELEILKMRSVSLEHSRFMFVFQRGIGIRGLRPFDAKLSPNIRPRRPLPDKKNMFSTGSRHIDSVIGGYPQGSLVMWEIGHNVPQLAYYSVALVSAANFLAQKRGVMVLPSLEFTYESIRPFVYPNMEVFRERARIFLDEARPEGPLRDVVVPISGDGQKDLESWNQTYLGFKKLGVPVLKIISVDLLEHLYGERGLEMLRKAFMHTSRYGDITIMLAKPGLTLAEELKYMATVRISLRSVEGYVIFKSITPYSGEYVYEPRFSRGYPDVYLYRIN